jgi:hypothetical protein
MCETPNCHHQAARSAAASVATRKTKRTPGIAKVPIPLYISQPQIVIEIKKQIQTQKKTSIISIIEIKFIVEIEIICRSDRYEFL